MTELTHQPVGPSPIIPLTAQHEADYRMLAKTKRLAKNTVKTSGTAQREWVKWCEAFKYDPQQITPERLVAFIADLARADKKANTIATYASLLGSEAKRVTGTNPRQHPDVVQAIANIERVIGTKEDKAEPITLPMLRNILVALDRIEDRVRAERMAAMCCVAYYSALRGSNLVDLKFGNVRFGYVTVEGAVVETVTLTIERSKTDQTGEGNEITLPATFTSTCPVRALKSWLMVHPFDRDDAPLFVSYRNGVPLKSCMSLQGWTNITREVLNLASVMNTDRYSSHSWRAGRATDLMGAGVPDTYGMQITGHKDEKVYHGYDRTQIADAQVIAALKVEQKYKG